MRPGLFGAFLELVAYKSRMKKKREHDLKIPSMYIESMGGRVIHTLKNYALFVKTALEVSLIIAT